MYFQWIWLMVEKGQGCTQFIYSLETYSWWFLQFVLSDDFWCHCFHANWCRILSININHILKINRSLKDYIYTHIQNHVNINIYIHIYLLCRHNHHREKLPTTSIGVILHKRPLHSRPLLSSRRCDANRATKSSTVQRATEQGGVSK